MLYSNQCCVYYNKVFGDFKKLGIAMPICQNIPEKKCMLYFQLFVRAFAADGSSKSIMVDEKMTIGLVISILADKNHVRLNSDLAVIEHMPELYMGKEYTGCGK